MPKPVRDLSIGHWDNPFRGDPNLAGVDVHQFGECPYENHTYQGKHPCAIWFFFWDGKVRAFQFEPDGKVISDFVWPQRLRNGDAFWANVDFTQGSDPHFKDHADPRPKKPISMSEPATP